MKFLLKDILFVTLIFQLLLPPIEAQAAVSPAAVGWGSLLVPGLGAGLRGHPDRAMFEAVSEIGLFYGGTFGAREGAFTIDSTVVIPEKGSLARPIFGTILQQFGLKLHMYNVFYNYQQAALEVKDLDREILNPQPLYQGSYGDVLAAPFQWKYLSSPWVFSLVLASVSYLFLDYHSTPLKRAQYTASSSEDLLYGVSQIGVIPLGSAFGEEPLFRGFMQREMRLYTGSLILSVLAQSIVFGAIHPADDRPIAFLSGLYFGGLTEMWKGDLGPSIAAHFWVNVVSGLVTYLKFRRQQGKETVLAPPVTMTLGFQF